MYLILKSLRMPDGSDFEGLSGGHRSLVRPQLAACHLSLSGAWMHIPPLLASGPIIAQALPPQVLFPPRSLPDCSQSMYLPHPSPPPTVLYHDILALSVRFVSTVQGKMSQHGVGGAVSVGWAAHPE